MRAKGRKPEGPQTRGRKEGKSETSRIERMGVEDRARTKEGKEGEPHTPPNESSREQKAGKPSPPRTHTQRHSPTEGRLVVTHKKSITPNIAPTNWPQWVHGWYGRHHKGHRMSHSTMQGSRNTHTPLTSQRPSERGRYLTSSFNNKVQASRSC